MTTAAARPTAQLIREDRGCARSGCACNRREGLVHCPAHDDANPSLSVSERDGRVLVRCHAGCTQDAVIGALRAAGVWPETEPQDGADHWTPYGPAVAEYKYTDASGQFLYAVCRTADKQFPVWRPDETSKSGKRWNLDGVERVLYRLAKVVKAIEAGAEKIYIVEGEKDVHAIEGAGGIATCNPGGAGKWADHFSLIAEGVDVVIVQDKDASGVKHARQVAAAVMDTALSVMVVEAAVGKDAFDHVAAGYQLDGFIEVWNSVDTASFSKYVTTVAADGMSPVGGVSGNGAVPTENPAVAAPTLLRASELRIEAIDWLWHPWLARGEFHLFDGDMEEGKTTDVMDLIARLSRGSVWPDTASIATAGTIVIMSAEDDYTRVLLPKLTAMGADLTRIFFFPLVGDEQSERLANIVEDIEVIERLCADVGADLLFIDPLFSYIGGKVQTGVDNQVRAALAPLSQMGRRLEMAILATRHTTKQKHANSKHMGSGSVAFSAFVRINWLAGPDPLNDAPERHVLAMNKLNLARRPASLSYEIRSHETKPEIGIVRWLGESDVSARDLNRAVNAESGVVAVKREDAEEFLLSYLAAGPQTSKEILSIAKDVHGIGRTTLFEAKKQLGIVAVKPEGRGNAAWAWQLPGHDEASGDASREGEGSGAHGGERTLPLNGTLYERNDAEIRGSREASGPPPATEPFTPREASGPPVDLDACVDGGAEVEQFTPDGRPYCNAHFTEPAAVPA